MVKFSRRSLSRSAVAAYLCICAALVLLLAVTAWGVYQDSTDLRKTLLMAELSRVRSMAERTTGRIERDLEVATLADLSELDQRQWLRQHWHRTVSPEDGQEYAAVVDNNGWIVLHSDPQREGQRLGHGWYDRRLMEFGSDVVLTDSVAIGFGQPAFDVSVPIEVRSTAADQAERQVGQYHAGVAVSRFQEQLEASQNQFLRRRLGVMGGVLFIVLLAATSLYYLATHSITLRRAMDTRSIERATEVSRLAGGLAHEIRNPLHAIQLNLHSLRRAHQRGRSLQSSEVDTILEQSSREIDRIEHLMQQLLGFATPAEARAETIDLVAELQAVIDFIDEELLRSNVALETRLAQRGVMVEMDSARLRQVMLNLLQNAEQAMPEGGRLRVSLRRGREWAEIILADDGPGIADNVRSRIFEPFFSTKENGTGLGLALVKRFVEEADGEIHCEGNEWGGATFRIRLPVAQHGSSSKQGPRP